MPHVVEAYRVEVDDQLLAFDDPKVTGRQILERAGNLPVSEFLLFQKLVSGMLEEIRLDETVDLEKPGFEQFLVFQSDRSFRLVIDDRRFEWGAPIITGLTLKALAGVDPTQFGVWLERRDEPDQFIADDEAVDLTAADVERFHTERLRRVCIEDDFFPWPQDSITTEQIAELGGWDPALGVIEVDRDQNERTLEPGEVVQLHPDNQFGKKLCWKRG